MRRGADLTAGATALVSGALLALALSFDEVNAVVTMVILLTLIPVGLAARIAGTGAVSRTGWR